MFLNQYADMLNMPIKPLKLSIKDRKIITELEKNSRQPAAQIARKTGLSTEVVNYRLKNMMSRGLIRRNYAIINFGKLGYTLYRILLQLENISEKDEDKIVEYLRSIPRARWIGVGSGAWDILMTVQARDVAEFNDIMNGILNKFGKNIRNRDITISVIQSIEPPAYLLQEEYRYEHFPIEEHRMKLDSTDYEILELLYKNARMPTTEMAAKLDLSSDAVQYRIKKMVKDKIITRFTCWMDRKLLGYQHYAVFLRLQHATAEQQERFIRFCESHPNVAFYASIIGSWDMQIDIDVEDSAHFHKVMREMRSKFLDIIRNYETVVIIQDFLCDTKFG